MVKIPLRPLTAIQIQEVDWDKDNSVISLIVYDFYGPIGYLRLAPDELEELGHNVKQSAKIARNLARPGLRPVPPTA